MNRILTFALIALVVLFGISKLRTRRMDSEIGYTRISAAQAKTMMQEKPTVIVDVRTAAEFAGGHIQGAINIPNESIGAQMPDQLDDLDATILIYCRSGARSANAARKLLGMGYNHVYDFGGVISWPDGLVR